MSQSEWIFFWFLDIRICRFSLMPPVFLATVVVVRISKSLTTWSSNKNRRECKDINYHALVSFSYSIPSSHFLPIIKNSKISHNQTNKPLAPFSLRFSPVSACNRENRRRDIGWQPRGNFTGQCICQDISSVVLHPLDHLPLSFLIKSGVK